MVIPVGKTVQTMMQVVKTAENTFTKREYGKFVFVPLVQDSNYHS